MKTPLVLALVILSLGAGCQRMHSANSESSAATSAQAEPHSVVHVVTVKWKTGTTPAQITAALEGVKALPAKYPGIVHIWTRSIKVQGGKANAFVMEFADEAALKAYTDSPAQKEWYKTYLPIRDESTTFDITN